MDNERSTLLYSGNVLCSTMKSWVNVAPSTVLGITVQGIKTKKGFVSKICMEKMYLTLAKVRKFVQSISIVRKKKSRTKTKMGQNDPFRRSSVILRHLC